MRRLLRMAERVLQAEGALMDARTLYRQLVDNLERARAGRARMLEKDPTLEKKLQRLKDKGGKIENSKYLYGGGSQTASDNYNALEGELEPFTNLTDLITAMEYALKDSIKKIPLLHNETVEQALSRFNEQKDKSEGTRYQLANEKMKLARTIREKGKEPETKLETISAQIDKAEADKKAASDQMENTERYMRAVQLANCDVDSPDDVSRAVAHQK